MSSKLDNIKLPQGLRSLNPEQLQDIAELLREELIESISGSGGHFASSLGCAELTVALHAAFNTPDDRLIWDVGHQAYIHKMLTGRRERMSSIRQSGGVSGFLKRSESEYDCFGAGHAGTSISAAVGMAAALRETHPERFIVSIIGDGALTAGMAFEALNHAGELKLSNLIVVLNDNEMSISPNVGAMSWFFSRSTTSETYTKVRTAFKRLHQGGYIPELVYKAIDRAEEATQAWFSAASLLFAAFGFRYIGPVDGHSVPELIQAFKNAKDQDVPVLIHARTIKGKGYEPAETDPLKWHGVIPFNRDRGEFLANGNKASAPAYTNVFADALIDLRSQDSRIVGITAAMPTGTGLDKFQAAHPDSFFDVGICEQHAVTFAAGLACEGKIPVCAIYSTFLQRAFDQVVHDVCIQNLPVVFAMDRAGVVGNDGETHQGVFDIAYLRAIPNITIMAGKDENELRQMLYTATKHNGPVALRYPRGNGVGIKIDTEFSEIPIGRAELVASGSDVALICLGPVVHLAKQVATQLQNELNISTTIVNARFAKPLDEQTLIQVISQHKLVCTWEDHSIISGFGSAIAELIADNGINLEFPLLRFGVQDDFVAHGTQAEQFVWNNMDISSVFRAVSSKLANSKTQIDITPSLKVANIL